ncbi:hypothetical protein SDC9_108025 [bioreactor metagenome]|uniref:Uncharacterized protein n=1 Tax=bioreactor metagenome TaxID=1076179 RepID=A0A645B6S9_9ZZZZ
MRCRRQDVVARFGGDEFVILLPNTDAQELEAVLNSVQSTMDNCKPDRGILSVSFGWATKYSTEEKYDQIFRKADDMMYNHKLVSKVQFDSSMMNHLGAILSEHSPKWRGHAQRVSRLCKQMGLCLGMEGRELSKLEMAGYLHDIGMAALDKEILDKTDDLSRYELQEIQRHCELGYKILSHVNGYRDVAEWVLHHHERPDGDGYPFGLKGQDIPQCSSIINIANAYDAISEGSVYGKKRPREEAIAELLSKAGTQFDERLTHIFVNQALDKEQEA